MAANVIIHQPKKTVMQSGRRSLGVWSLEYISDDLSVCENNVMGWTGGRNSVFDVKLEFNNKEDAISYAKSEGLSYEVLEPVDFKVDRKCYADNFAYCPIGED